MPIRTACPNCDRPHTLADDTAGKLIRCKGCDKPFRVEEVADAVAVPDDRPRRDDDRPRRRRDEDDDDRDRRPRRKGSNAALWVWLGVGGGVLLIGGVVLAVVLTRDGSGGGGGGGGAGRGNPGAPVSKIVTADNLARITPDMTDGEVINLLGNQSFIEGAGVGNRFVGAGRVYVWQNGSDYLKVFFINGKAKGKASKFGGSTSHEQWGP
jgi:hypothetical protein